MQSYQELMYALDVKERTLRVVREEYDLLNACGGVFPNDIARLRGVIVGNNNTEQPQPYGVNQHQPPVAAIVIKDEPEDNTVPRHHNQPTTSLKAMLQGMLPCLLSDAHMIQLCKRIKRRISNVYTFRRHQATFVLAADWEPIRDALQVEIAENGWRYSLEGYDGTAEMGDGI